MIKSKQDKHIDTTRYNVLTLSPITKLGSDSRWIRRVVGLVVRLKISNCDWKFPYFVPSHWSSVSGRDDELGK